MPYPFLNPLEFPELGPLADTGIFPVSVEPAVDDLVPVAGNAHTGTAFAYCGLSFQLWSRHVANYSCGFATICKSLI
jgi:hypothetical protein